jgi:PPK2 family polyphosphate:nucleotide phosphotransferase
VTADSDEKHGHTLEEKLQQLSSRWRIADSHELTGTPSIYTPPDDELVGSGESFKARLSETRKEIRELQRKLYAGKQYSFLLVFQALDAAGKDGAIREVLEDLDPAGIRVSSFKRPSEEELRHDFLWRTAKQLPQRGEICAFNRSYYEEVLTVRVHPELLGGQYGDVAPDPEALWPARYRAIREHEQHLAMSNTVVLKFWLNVSLQKQAQRFLERLEDPQKNWKFSMGDIRESNLREQYDEAVMHMLNETSRPWAPWFCIPADDRWYLRWQIADIFCQALKSLPLKFPPAEIPHGSERDELGRMLAERANQG